MTQAADFFVSYRLTLLEASLSVAELLEEKRVVSSQLIQLFLESSLHFLFALFKFLQFSLVHRLLSCILNHKKLHLLFFTRLHFVKFVLSVEG